MEVDLEAAYEAGRAAWPGLDLPPGPFARFMGERPDAMPHAIVRGPDLYLACACQERIAGADTAFLDSFLPRLLLWLGSYGARPEVVDEVRQILAIRVLVGEGSKPPAIREYSGRGSLEGWVRTTATRQAIAIAKGERRYVADGESTLAGELLSIDEEMSRLKRTYRAPVLRAFEGACRALVSSHRALLRLHYVHGLTGASLATMYGISRATLNRRLAEAREALASQVGVELERTAGVEAKDVQSVLRLVRSQLDLRLSLLLAESAFAAPDP